MSMHSRHPVLVALLSIGPLSACVTDHDVLARSPEPEPSASALAGDASTAPSEGGVQSPGDADPVGSEPDGPRSLTVVNGVTDSQSPILLCLSRVEGNTVHPPIGAPFPSGGLGYGARLVINDGDGVDLVNDGLRFHVISGELSLVNDLDCSQALADAARIEAQSTVPDGGNVGAPDGSADAAVPDAASDGSADASPDGPSGEGAASPGLQPMTLTGADAGDGSTSLPLPPIRVRSLAVIPAKTLDDSRSYLMVLAGCMGGEAFTHESEQLICGDHYRPTFPTLSPTVVALSRQVTAAKVGLQFVNASLAMPSAELLSASNAAGTIEDIEIATGVIPGEIVPSVPSREDSVGTLAANGDLARLLLRNTNGTTALFEAAWATVRDLGSIEALSDGKNYTLVLAGPHPAQAAGRWWNGPVLTLVENDP